MAIHYIIAMETFTGLQVRWYLTDDASQIVATASRAEATWLPDAPEMVRWLAQRTHEMLRDGHTDIVRQMATDRVVDGRLIRRGHAW